MLDAIWVKSMSGDYGLGGYYYSSWQKLSDAPADSFGTLNVGGDIAGISVTGNITGPITAGGSIGHLGELTDDGEYGGYYDFYGSGITAGKNIDAVIDAGGDITTIYAGKNISNQIQAGRDIGSINAGGLTASFQAGRNMGSVSATGSISGVFTAGQRHR